MLYIASGWCITIWISNRYIYIMNSHSRLCAIAVCTSFKVVQSLWNESQIDPHDTQKIADTLTFIVQQGLLCKHTYRIRAHPYMCGCSGFLYFHAFQLFTTPDVCVEFHVWIDTEIYISFIPFFFAIHIFYNEEIFQHIEKVSKETCPTILIAINIQQTNMSVGLLGPI